MPSALVNQLATLTELEINAFDTSINDNGDLLVVSQNEIANKERELIERQQIQVTQLTEIEDKEKLLLTRSRMLPVVQNKNAYKKKIIYTLIALIFFIFIFTIVMYVLFERKISAIKINN